MRDFIRFFIQPLVSLFDARFLYLFIPATFILVTDWPAFEALVKTFCVFYALLGLGHLLRKIMIPYLDLSVFVSKSSENPLSAAIVVAAVFFFILAMTVIPIWWIKP